MGSYDPTVAFCKQYKPNEFTVVKSPQDQTEVPLQNVLVSRETIVQRYLCLVPREADSF